MDIIDKETWLAKSVAFDTTSSPCVYLAREEKKGLKRSGQAFVSP